jgi:hypothetical protein
MKGAHSIFKPVRRSRRHFPQDGLRPLQVRPYNAGSLARFRAAIDAYQGEKKGLPG